jgi:hypothetical protein
MIRFFHGEQLRAIFTQRRKVRKENQAIQKLGVLCGFARGLRFCSQEFFYGEQLRAIFTQRRKVRKENQAIQKLGVLCGFARGLRFCSQEFFTESS